MQNATVASKIVARESLRVPHEIPLSDIQNSVVQRGIDLWTHARASRAFPSRADMSPRVLSDLLRNTVLVRVLPGANDYELRIIGDAMVQAQRRSFQGMNTAEIDMLMPGFGTVLHTVYSAVCERRAPIAIRGWFHNMADGRSLFHETAVLPLGPDANVVDHILVFATYAYTYGDKVR